MQTIILETKIAAPIERCFLLSLSIDLHMKSASQTEERAVAGVTHGLIGPDQTVTWRGRHFGLMLTHESQITRYELPNFFQDTMIRGAFHSLVHDHRFASTGDGMTLMRDELHFAAPLGIIGRVVEPILKSYLTKFLRERNGVIRKSAEGEGWGEFLK